MSDLLPDSSSPTALPGQSVNPYAASAVADRGIDMHVGKKTVGGLALVIRTILAITLSGVIFGVGCVIVFAITTAFATGGRGFFGDGESAVAALLMFSIAGAIFAGVSATVVSTIAYLIYRTVRDSAVPIGGKQVLMFCSICGFLSGWFPLSILSGLRLQTMAFSFVPAVTGALIAPLCLIPYVRRVKRANEDYAVQLEKEESLGGEVKVSSLGLSSPFSMPNESDWKEEPAGDIDVHETDVRGGPTT